MIVKLYQCQSCMRVSASNNCPNPMCDHTTGLNEIILNAEPGRCPHWRLDEDGICRSCGQDCRGI